MDLIKQVDQLLVVYGLRLKGGYASATFMTLIYLDMLNRLIVTFDGLATSGLMAIFIKNPIVIWIAHFSFSCRKPRIAQLLRNMEYKIAPGFHTQLRKTWRYYMTASLLYFVLDVGSDVVSIYGATPSFEHVNKYMHFDVSTYPSLVVLCRAVTSLYQNTFFFATFALYDYLLRCLNHVHMTYFHVTLKTEKSVVKLRLAWQEILDIRNDFEKLFSFYPLLWHAVLFRRCMHYITSFNKLRFELSWQLLVVSYWMMSKAIYTFSVLYTISDVNSNLQDMFATFQRQVITLGENYHRQLLVQDIERTLLVKFSGGGLFDLNKNLVLGFVSALVSFSVLFIQLSA